MSSEPDVSRRARRAGSGAARTPRVLEVDLSAFAQGGAARTLATRAWSDGDATVARIGSFGGSALCVALFLASEDGLAAEREPARAQTRLVFAAGAAVRAGLPTAARASVAGLSPLSGRYVEGALGSDFARRLATLADALVLRGRAPDARGLVLVLDADGAEVCAELRAFPELAGLSPAACARRVRELVGDGGSVHIGPAGERGLPFATLASGAEPPSFVGRGGLGAVFGALGLKALVVRAAPVPDADDERARAFTALCTRSPRLRARASGGTLEIAGAFAARDEATTPAWSLVGAAPSPRRERKGCAGCPTPCGFVFERADGPRGAHFSALEPLSHALGLERFDDALALLACCDEAGVDAKEIGALLALVDRARELGRLPGARLAGDVHALSAFVAALAHGTLAGSDTPALALAARGVAHAARVLGLDAGARVLHGQAVRVERGAASRLGLYVSARGGDPLRTLAFLAGDVPASDALARLCAPFPAPAFARELADPRGSGFSVWWSENLANALDAQGVCAFSCSALLADGVATLDELAALLAEPADAAEGKIADAQLAAPGLALLARGASIALAQHALAERIAARSAARADEPPEWLRDVLAHPDGWPAYARLRGLDARGGVSADVWRAAGELGLLERAQRELAAAPLRADAPAHGRAANGAVARAPGTLVLRSTGPLAACLGARRSVTCVLPAALGDVLRRLARDEPRAANLLVRGDHLVPVVYRSGTRLDPADLLSAADELDLVVALSGG